MYNQGTGRIAPEDTEEFIEITVTFKNGEVENAGYKCTEDETMKDCAKTVCRVIKGHNAPDIMQITNNAVFYNTEKKIPRMELYKGAMATMAAKKAVKDYADKNGIELKNTGCCGCL